MRLIDADAYQFPGDLVNEPTIDAVPVVHGRWLYVDGKGIHAEYECDNCREHVCFDEKIDGSIPAYERCPHCGAKMDGGKDDQISD